METSESNSECWWLPLTFTTKEELDFSNTRPRHWLLCPAESEYIFNLPKDDEWILFNIQGTGSYLKIISESYLTCMFLLKFKLIRKPIN